MYKKRNGVVPGGEGEGEERKRGVGIVLSVSSAWSLTCTRWLKIRFKYMQQENESLYSQANNEFHWNVQPAATD